MLGSQSADFKPLSPESTRDFIHHNLDRCGLPHNTFTTEAINLICKVALGNLRAVKNLAIGAMVEAIRSQRHVAFATILIPGLRRSNLHYA